MLPYIGEHEVNRASEIMDREQPEAVMYLNLLKENLSRFPVTWIYSMAFLANFQIKVSEYKRDQRIGYTNAITNVITYDFMQDTQKCLKVIERQKFPHRPLWKIRVDNSVFTMEGFPWNTIAVTYAGGPQMPHHLPIDRYIPHQSTKILYEDFVNNPHKYTTCLDYSRSRASTSSEL
jgi:hypothetical protein